MNGERIAREGILVLPHLRIQNANAIASPLTHGFPAITAFTGFMWALERKLAAANIDLGLDAVGVICHAHQEQTAEGYVQRFHLTRNPANEKGEPAAIVEEGRIHLDVTLVFSAFWKTDHAGKSIFLQDMAAERHALGKRITQHVMAMRVAGGSLVSAEPGAQLIAIAEGSEQRARDFRYWRRQWLPGFSLVSRDDLLQNRWRQLQTKNPATTLLDAWLDASRFNWRCIQSADEKVRWEHDRDQGWIVPIAVGYGALSPLHDAGTVRNARDTTTPFRFVESLHTLGQWISPHRLHDVDDLLWYADTQSAHGLYRLRNNYVSPPESD